ncbi:unnamed protein product [Pedinophyceae sp. YPF-701]|nr:unnamed protein product [Pedinophyceae sp. YPF-701]
MESFQVLRRIGTGTYGSAFLVCLKEDESRRFVLKKINMSQMSERERAAAHQEVRLLAQLDHPFVLGYHDSFQHRGHMCIVTEYCEAGDLYRLLKRQNEPLPEEQIKEWLAQVTLALHYIHERKVVHRDLKSQNIFLTRDGSAKLGDFGIARVLSSPQELARTVIGTPYYMSPEIVRNQPYSYQSDVWSLGCVVFEMATGKHAFDAADMNALVMKILRGKVDRLGPQYSPDLQQLLDLMLARDPARRPTTEQILHCPFLREHVVEAKHEAAVWRAGRGKKGGTPARDTPPPPPASAGARAPVLRQRSQSMHDHAAASSAHGEPRTSGKLPAKQHTPAGSASHRHHHRHHHHHHHHSHHHSQSYHDPAHRRSRSDVRTSEPAASLAPAPPLPPGPQQRHLRADPRLAGVRSRSVAQIQVTREADAAPEWLRREGPPAQGGVRGTRSWSGRSRSAGARERAADGRRRRRSAFSSTATGGGSAWRRSRPGTSGGGASHYPPLCRGRGTRAACTTCAGRSRSAPCSTSATPRRSPSASASAAPRAPRRWRRAANAA